MGVGDPISLGITSSGRPPSQDFRFAILASIDYTSDAGCNLFHATFPAHRSSVITATVETEA
jgi:hypothetical protein